MVSFLIILVTVLAVFTVAALWALRYLLARRALFICRVLVGVVFFGAAVSFFSRRNPLAAFLSDGATISLASVFFLALMFLFLFVLAAVVLRAVYRRTLAVPEDVGRRRVLKAAGAYPAAALGAALYGNLYERNATVERRYDIPVAAPALAGYTVAQLSDVHLGMFFSVEDFDALLAETAAGGADLLAVTGDVFDDERLNARAAEVLAAHVGDFRDGIWYCIGNHEYYHSGRPIVDRMAEEGRVHVVLNSAARVAGRGTLYIAGVDYPFARGDAFDPQKKAYFAAAMTHVPEDAVTILLAHHPEFIDDAAAHGSVLLTLTGHTHGSQFGILGQPLFPVFKYTRGMVCIGDSHGYVHTGNGSWFPLRIGCPPEIAYFRLERTVQ